MAHNLSTYTDANGITRRTMLSLRESPWHGLGQLIQAPVGSADAIKLAGLDWTVNLHGLYTNTMDPVTGGYRGVIRSDTKSCLGITSERFTPVQNSELFNWFDSLSQAGVVYETAGALGQGETVWILARMPAEIRIGNDVTKPYMLIFNGHGGNKPVVVAPTGVRVVCQNTLRLASRDIRSSRGRSKLEAGYRIRHTKGVHAALEDVAEAYRKTMTSISDTQDAYSHLARVPMSEAMFSAVMARAFKAEATGEAGRAETIRKGREESIRTILASQTCTGNGISGTAFALLNAVTEYVDHERTTRTNDAQDEKKQRFASANWGSGATIKDDAFSAVLELANA